MNNNDEHNDQWLAQVAPTLAGISKDNHFELPRDGFRDLSKEIESDVDDLEFISENAPTLNAVEDDLLLTPEGYSPGAIIPLGEVEYNEFLTPESFFNRQRTDIEQQTIVGEEYHYPQGYFEKLERSIMEKVEDQKHSPKVVPIWAKTQVWVSAAAVAALLVAGYFVIQPEQEPCLTFACLFEQYEITEDDYLLFEDEEMEQMLFDETTILIEEDEDYLEYLLDTDMALEELLGDEDY